MTDEIKFHFSSSSSKVPVKKFTTIDTEEDYDQLRSHYSVEIEKTLQKSLESTERSLRCLDNAEQNGVTTARELLIQGERLKRAEKNVDEIHHNTKIVQRNLEILSAPFMGMFKREYKKKLSETAVPQSELESSTCLTEKVAGLSSEEGFTPFAKSSEGSQQHTLNESSRAVIREFRLEELDNQIEENLAIIISRTSNLRSLGLDIAVEMGSQRKMIDRIHDKMERNNVIMKVQDKEIQRIIGPGSSSCRKTTDPLTRSMEKPKKVSFVKKVKSLFKSSSPSTTST